ncbi:hypothetical protein C8F04DRAFT_1105733 [Mycena alexandri]|uniref:Uncharacterized protein n=1 Tax=Mycena alexandri TaxID=1745969 RepID=A0AAD6SSS0_9AGAR|nr:hypothetical protein C8F04DRAFT_1127743 [Mycena alexandri]KAJ7033000.1 hypothetical protein C8F04DRAFT_1105733 [Mycena alexandri]
MLIVAGIRMRASEVLCSPGLYFMAKWPSLPGLARPMFFSAFFSSVLELITSHFLSSAFPYYILLLSSCRPAASSYAAHLLRTRPSVGGFLSATPPAKAPLQSCVCSQFSGLSPQVPTHLWRPASRSAFRIQYAPCVFLNSSAYLPPSTRGPSSSERLLSI